MRDGESTGSPGHSGVVCRGGNSVRDDEATVPGACWRAMLDEPDARTRGVVDEVEFTAALGDRPGCLAPDPKRGRQDISMAAWIKVRCTSGHCHPIYDESGKAADQKQAIEVVEAAVGVDQAVSNKGGGI